MHLCRALIQKARVLESPAAEAFAACDRAVEAERTNPYFYTAAVGGAVQLGDLARAKRLVQNGLKLYPSLGPLQYQLGFIMLQEGQLKAAEETLRSAVAAAEWHGDSAGLQAAQRALSEAERRHRR